MRAGARRLLFRPLTAPARRALLAACLWLTGAAAAVQAGPEAVGVDAAHYLEPTTRYPHGALGDAQEYGALSLQVSDGREVLIRLPEARVFEDVAPRLADVDGDGLAEAIVVESAAAQGARLAIYGPGGLIAATPYIGQRFRWLAPLGVADLDGDGRVELAYVDRPHLARTLRVWRLEAGRLVQVAHLAGVTNHRFGWPHIPGGIRLCDGQAEMILADAQWRRVVAVRLTGGRLVRRDLGRYDGDGALDRALECRGSPGE